MSLQTMTMRKFISASALLALSACHGLLDVSNPTLTRDQDIANAAGANARRQNAVYGFMSQIQIAIHDASILTDEWSIDYNYLQTPNVNDAFTLLDLRDSQGYENAHTDQDSYLGSLDDIITKSSVAIPQIRQYTPDSLKGDFLAQLFAYRGYAITQMAETVCPGFPINDVSPDNNPIYSGPYSTDAALQYAIAQLDSALTDARDSTNFLNLARVVKGRALLDLGQYDSAAAAVTGVPDNFVYQNQLVGNGAGIGNPFSTYPGDDWSYYGNPVGEQEGANGIAFVSETDPRVPTIYKRQRLVDTTVAEYDQLKYPDPTTRIVLASGTEARLIEAEASLHADPNGGSWLATLNHLRASVAGLQDLQDPGTSNGRVDLIYHERAFWLYLTGRRLGDMRRLIRLYNRNAETVFPTGMSWRGVSYKTGTAIPFSFANQAQYNPHITAGCTTR